MTTTRLKTAAAEAIVARTAPDADIQTVEPVEVPVILHSALQLQHEKEEMEDSHIDSDGDVNPNVNDKCEEVMKKKYETEAVEELKENTVDKNLPDNLLIMLQIILLRDAVSLKEE